MLTDEQSSKLKQAGYINLKAFFSSHELETYWEYMKVHFLGSNVKYGKLFGKEYSNYITPWITDKFGFCSSFRVYTQEHTRLNFVEQKLLPLRKQLEEIEDELGSNITRNRIFFDINAYYFASGSYPKHRDAEMEFCEYQCQMMITQPGVDFMGGDLMLEDNSGVEISLLHDLGGEAGDLLIFDKRLLHWVTKSTSAQNGRGRLISLFDSSINVSADQKNTVNLLSRRQRLESWLLKRKIQNTFKLK